MPLDDSITGSPQDIVTMHIGTNDSWQKPQNCKGCGKVAKQSNSAIAKWAPRNQMRNA
ncbi:cellulose-binding protein [Histoplasma capsulatum var. duboisii H88]|uniref:Cellulose-binding protein n=1 Tax=Ajellomyces capsulatus (strain H88) TaxID=544711 RepID=F0UF37_AJEC8|nr:cellulose-binding protein [Histoplasma capsulatum var. duboisii H88]